MPLDEDETSALVEAIRLVEAEYGSDVYLYSGPINEKGFGQLIKSFMPVRRKSALLVLSTDGGLANSAYQIARFFQRQYDDFIIFIPFRCKSAGTLIALGANRLIMGPFSELGPLDVQLFERDEIGSRKSGLLTHSAFEALHEESFALYEHFLLSIKARSADNISFSVASDVAAQITAAAMTPIYDQISPAVLGSDYRDLRVAVEYGARLASHSENAELDAITRLTENYPSHDFIIDSTEAKTLFHEVDEAGANLYRLLSFIMQFVYREHEGGAIMCLSELTGTAKGEDDDDGKGSRDDVDELDDSPEADRPGDDEQIEGDHDDASHMRKRRVGRQPRDNAGDKTVPL